MAFLDDFNRADEYLEASANWTQSGVANAAGVRSNVLACLTTDGSGGLYLCPDQGSANHYSQATLKQSVIFAPFMCIRATDNLNYIGFRHDASAGAWQIYKRVAATYTLLGSYTVGVPPGVIRLEADSSNNIRGYVGGVLRIGPITDSFNSTVTRQGIVARGAILNSWLDDFEAGALGGGGVTIPVFVHHYRQQGIM